MIRFELPEVVVICITVWAILSLFMTISMSAEVGRMRDFLEKRFPPEDDDADDADWWKKGKRR